MPRWLLRSLLFALGLAIGLLGPWVWWLDREVSLRFADRHLTEASRVYARPLELHDGRALSHRDLLVELEATGLRAGSPERPGRFRVEGERIDLHLPAFDFPDGHQPAQRGAVRVRGGRVELLGEAAVLRLPPAELGRILPLDDRVRTMLELAEFPPLLVAGAQAVEDRRFKHHFGIDLRGLARAMWANLRAGEVVQGGSTVTQQLVKNLFLTPERSLLRKFNEAIMAVSLELRFSKAEILEAWLNEVYMGQDGRRAIHGFGRAAEYYFGQPLEALDAGQIALLVGMARGASWYHPLRNPEHARDRRNLVLAMFHETGLIGEATLQRQRQAGLGLRPSLRSGASQYGAFLDLVGRQLRSDYRDRDLRGTGLRVFTTLSPSAQRRAETALAEGLVRVESEPDFLQGAIVLLEPDSGEVRALVGDRVRGRHGFNRALDARRQVGSVIKPLVYMLALARPEAFTLVTPVADEPLTVDISGSGPWQPVNHDEVSHGKVPLLEALARSYNQASVRVGLAVGVDALFELMRQLGVAPGRDAHPAAFLGAVNLTPLQVAQLYQPIASEGYSAPVRSVREVVDSDGETIARYPLRLKSLKQREALALVDFALRRVVTHGTGRSLSRLLTDDPGVRGKTGTTNDRRDAWFVGYTNDWLGVVWAGRDDNKPAGVGGASTALPVWAGLFNELPTRPVRSGWPDSVEWFWVEWPQPKLAAEYCDGAVAIPFIAGSQPEVLSDCLERRGSGPFNR
ncbi:MULTISPECIES: penicillin-binding protein 1B [unclassified Wenzhouxiangella]|uniref:penicillin-binding protein 1B n=1 Tax=unclassified Wenzhouxiangella TaxID=2613841 RepID=UPI0015F26D05|nr:MULTISPECIES: penicillin-binding protein 1B [unclassified Wenzhouxiangella]